MMKKVLGILLLTGFLFLTSTGILGYFLHLEHGNQIYKLFAIFYLCIPGIVAFYLAKKEGIEFSLKNNRLMVTILALLLPLLLLILATLITFTFSLDEAKDSLMIAPTHGLTVKHRVLQIVSISSNIALLTVFYGLTLQFIIALGEELMWRGYFLAVLNVEGFWKKAIFIGMISGMWLIPLSYFYGWFYPDHFILGPVWIVLLSVLLSPILLHLRLASNSLLAPMLFHAFFYSMASLLPLIMNEPNYLLGGMTGLAGFLALLLINIVLIPFYRKVDVEDISMNL